MFGIQFTRNGDKECTQVIARIETDLNVERSVLEFTWECGKQYQAELLRIHLEQKYHALIEAAHKNAYEMGHKDGKGHKKKRTLFAKCFQKDGRCCF